MNDLKKIADYYGTHSQIGKLLEELDELRVAARGAFLDLTVSPEISSDSLTKLVDELADVAIMIEQVAYLTDTVDAVRDRVMFKVDRQLSRIAVEVNNEQSNH